MTFGDLEVGMITSDGLITSLRKANSGDPFHNLTGEEADRYFENSNVVEYFMHEDSYVGQCSMTGADDQEYKEKFERGSLAYTNCVGGMIRERKNAIIDANNDVILMLDLLMVNMDGKNGK